MLLSSTLTFFQPTQLKKGKNKSESQGLTPSSWDLACKMRRGGWPCLHFVSNAYCGSRHSCPLSQWCHPAISSSVVPFSSCLQPFPATRYFPVSQLFTKGGQSISASGSVSVLSMNIQDWFPIGLTGLISLQSKGLSRVFSSTTVEKYQSFGYVMWTADSLEETLMLFEGRRRKEWQRMRWLDGIIYSNSWVWTYSDR